jgi:hypothetical protein
MGGAWEAKDSSDNLEKEITKKHAQGYSLVNTLFEDTRTANLYQNNKPHPSSPFDRWQDAVEDFKDRAMLIPQRLAFPRVQSRWRPIRILYA